MSNAGEKKLPGRKGRTGERRGRKKKALCSCTYMKTGRCWKCIVGEKAEEQQAHRHPAREKGEIPKGRGAKKWSDFNVGQAINTKTCQQRWGQYYTTTNLLRQSENKDKDVHCAQSEATRKGRKPKKNRGGGRVGGGGGDGREVYLLRNMYHKRRSLGLVTDAICHTGGAQSVGERALCKKTTKTAGKWWEEEYY